MLPPVIISQPSNVTLVTGQTAVVTVGVTGRNLEYQWFAVGSSLGGTDMALTDTNSSLEIVNITRASHDGASFYVEVSNNAGVAISDTVTITIG